MRTETKPLSLFFALLQGYGMLRHAKRFGSIYLGTDTMLLPIGSIHLKDAIVCENASEIAVAVYHLTPTGHITPEAFFGILNEGFISERELELGK